jgi:hypothetical protein
MFFLIIFALCIVGLGLLALVVAGKFPLNSYPVLMMPTLFLIFVVNALQLHSNTVAYSYINESTFILSSFVCLVSFLAVIAGWCYRDILPKKPQPSQPSPRFYFPYDRLFTIGTICHILSFIAEFLIASRRGGFFALYSEAHSFYKGDENPFLFYLFFLTFVGTVPYLQCLFCNKKLPLHQKIIIITVCALQIVRTIIVGQRGWAFNLVFIYLTVPFFCLGKQPKIRQVAYFLIPTALFVLIIPGIRNHVYLGSNNLTQVPQLAVEALASIKEGNAGSGVADLEDSSRVSSEFILGSALISAAWEKNAYTYGLSFYDFLINPIPRAIWQDKPKNVGLQSQIDTINNHYLWKFNPGSAVTGIADVFLNFGFFCIPFWFFFALVHRAVYNAASIPGNFYAQGIYACLLWGSTFLLNQSVLLWGTTIINSVFFTTLFYSYARMIKPHNRLSIRSLGHENSTH